MNYNTIADSKCQGIFPTCFCARQSGKLSHCCCFQARQHVGIGIENHLRRGMSEKLLDKFLLMYENRGENE